MAAEVFLSGESYGTIEIKLSMTLSNVDVTVCLRSESAHPESDRPAGI